MARDIGEWLEGLDLGIYAEAFVENEIDLGALPHLGEADLKELGLPMGPRKKLLAAISELETGDQRSSYAGAPELTRREAERRHVTVLFADVVSFTKTSEKLGDEKTFVLMERLFGLMAETVRKHGGSVRNFTGDGIMALFGEPVALEDAPLRACRAAMGIQSQIMDVGPEIEVEHGVRPQLRIGIHTGPVVVGKVGGSLGSDITALGDTVNLAARLESAAEPDGVLMSEATNRLVEGYVESSFGGKRALKGKSEPQRVWRLDGIKTAATRFSVALDAGLTGFVGRERELEDLESYWSAVKQAEVRLVNVVGEAGIGKSRLIHEFRQRMSQPSNVIR